MSAGKFNSAPVTEAEAKSLEGFTKGGGTLLAPPAGWKFPQVPESQITPGRRQLEQMEPMWEVAYRATVRKKLAAHGLAHVHLPPGERE